MPATKVLAGMARSYGCPTLSSDLAIVFFSLRRMAITNDLAAVFDQPSQMASISQVVPTKAFRTSGKSVQQEE